MELITKSFANQCIAFPARVEQMLAHVETVEEAKGILDKASAMQHYAEKLKAGVDVERPIALGVLKIKAKLGELLPAKPPKERGRGKKNGKPDLPFSKPIRSAYRKLAKHQDKLDSWYESIEDVPTQTDFIRQISESVKKAKRNGKPRCSHEEFPPGTVVDSLVKLTGRKFATIYADPPWAYGNQGTRAATKNHYDTMSAEQICAMPVSELAADDAQLHLWTTNGFLREAFDVIDAWGFSYRSCFVWCKPQMGIGNYWRVSHEFLLLGIRGSATFNDKSMKSWAELDRGEHSAKPEAVRAMIERAFVGPRLEMFGRMAIDGWTVMGNQVERSLYVK